jgi:hypothetical protein
MILWLASLGFRPRADILPGLVQRGVSVHEPTH